MLQNMFFKGKHEWKKKGKERTTNEGGNGKGKEIGMHPHPLKETGVPLMTRPKLFSYNAKII